MNEKVFNHNHLARGIALSFLFLFLLMASSATSVQTRSSVLTAFSSPLVRASTQSSPPPLGYESLASFGDSSATTNGEFGYSVAASGGIVVVGAPDESAGGVQDAGNVYVFNATSGTFLYSLQDPVQIQQDEEFGYSVAVSVSQGGPNYVVVGAPNFNPCSNCNSEEDAGIAYVFELGSTSIYCNLTSMHTQENAHFGTSVAISSSGSIVAGAYHESTNVNKPSIGAAYTYSTADEVTNGNSMTCPALDELKNPNPQAAGDFGVSVGISPSGGTIVVGADGYTSGQYSAGAAYIYNNPAKSPIATEIDLNSATCMCNTWFGFSVAASDSVVVVGAWGDSPDGMTSAGQAYVYSSTGSLATILQDPYLVAAGELFGDAVAANGNYIVVGAPYDTISGSAAGSAYVFDATTYDYEYTLSSTNPIVDGKFGSSVAASLAPYSSQPIFVAGARAESSGNGYAFSPPTIVLSPSSGPPGTNVDVQGSFFGQSTPPITINFNSIAVGQVTLPLSPGGAFSAMITVPASMATEYPIQATDEPGIISAASAFTVQTGKTTIDQTGINFIISNEGDADSSDIQANGECPGASGSNTNCYFLPTGLTTTTGPGTYGMYNDDSGYCTVGIGKLVDGHKSCTQNLATIAESATEMNCGSTPVLQCFDSYQNAYNLMSGSIVTATNQVSCGLPGIQLSQNQLDALIDLTYNRGNLGSNGQCTCSPKPPTKCNTGPGDLITTITTFNSDYCNRILQNFQLFNRPASVVGRRVKEANLFNTGTDCYPTTPYSG